MSTPAVPIRAPHVPRARKLQMVLLASLALAAAGIAVWLLASGFSGAREPAGPDPVAQAAFLEKTGVEIVRIATTGRGGLVDLRFRVIDPDRAGVVHDPARKPAIVDERTGRVVDALFMGHSHGGRFKAGQTYYLIFVNRQGLVERGGLVSVILGGTRLEHVHVR